MIKYMQNEKLMILFTVLSLSYHQRTTGFMGGGLFFLPLAPVEHCNAAVLRAQTWLHHL